MRALLSRPALYRALGVALGAPRSRAVFAREHVRAARGQRLLDLGCGTGDMVPHLPGVDYVGFDPSEAYVAAARRAHPRARFEQASAGDFAVEPGTFDLAIACGVLHHLDDADAFALLDLARRALRPGGRLVALEPCRAPDQGRVARWLIAADRGRHVRDRAGYLALARSVFPAVQARLRDDLLRVPYTHLVLQCER